MERIGKKLLNLQANGGNSNEKPIVFNLNKQEDRASLGELLDNGKIVRVVDKYDILLEELEEIKNPEKIFDSKLGKRVLLENCLFQGLWIYYPWSSILVHCLGKEDFTALRLSRNKNLITDSEQNKLSDLKIGITGLNVGNSAALCLALEGIGSVYKLADPDGLTLSNFNRFRSSICEMGTNKAVLTAKQIYETNPFVFIEVYRQGIGADNLADFLAKPRLDVLIEEMDHLPLKLAIREKARDLGIPVLMVTGNGENVIIDVERFDQNKNLPLLNGRLEQKVVLGIGNSGNKKTEERLLLARDFMGEDNLCLELRESFKEVGKILAGIPQLAETSFARGAILCYLVRNLFIHGKIKSGRYHFMPKAIFNN